ncbi:hypothetical protein Acr_00g0028690 [Actinidia rufa]|uniref:Uncharacterized protein n=1 Tax=Actinidia rufa TaxID=165716 RepID=A0A7J0DEB3_9ERIC|nr:hypothetical protein Acr_00g0028690 [Actinidia rufa]
MDQEREERERREERIGWSPKRDSVLPAPPPPETTRSGTDRRRRRTPRGSVAAARLIRCCRSATSSNTSSPTRSVASEADSRDLSPLPHLARCNPTTPAHFYTRVATIRISEGAL